METDSSSFISHILSHKKKILAMTFLLLAGAINVPKMLSSRYKKKWPEVPANLNGIRTAQLYYHSKFGTYVHCDLFPGKPNPSMRAWEIKESGGFMTLGWASDGKVQGGYWVEVVSSGSDFVATGIADVDGDGVYATWVATKSKNASYEPINGPGVH